MQGCSYLDDFGNCLFPELLSKHLRHDSSLLLQAQPSYISSITCYRFLICMFTGEPYALTLEGFALSSCQWWPLRQLGWSFMFNGHSCLSKLFAHPAVARIDANPSWTVQIKQRQFVGYTCCCSTHLKITASQTEVEEGTLTAVCAHIARKLMRRNAWVPKYRFHERGWGRRAFLLGLDWFRKKYTSYLSSNYTELGAVRACWMFHTEKTRFSVSQRSTVNCQF